jgi:YD repeat-containing protein
LCATAFGAEPDDSVSYTYDKNGNVLTVTDANGTITRFYDKLNRVTKYSNHQGNVLQYAYNEVGNLVTLTYPDGKQVHSRLKFFFKKL